MKTLKRLLIKVAILAMAAIGAMTTEAETLGTVRSELLNIRQKPSTSSKILETIELGDTITIAKTVIGERVDVGGHTEDYWYYIGYYNKDTNKTVKGYVLAYHVKDYVKPNYGYVSMDKLPLRAKAKLGATVVKKLYKGDKVRIIGVYGYFVKVQALHGNNTYEGYLVPIYLEKSKEACYGPELPAAGNYQVGFVNYSYLRLRKKASTSGAVVVKLTRKDPMIIYKVYASGWYKVKAYHDGKPYSGYVCGDYVEIVI